MADKKIGIVLGVSGEQQSAQAIEQVAQRGATAFERFQTTVSRAGNAADFAEGKVKRLGRGVNDAAGAVQLMSPLLGGLGSNFGNLAATVGNVSDVFGTLSSILLRNPIGLVAIAITGAVTAFAAYNARADDSAAKTDKLAETLVVAQKTLKELGQAASATSEENLAKFKEELLDSGARAAELQGKVDQISAALKRGAEETERYRQVQSTLELPRLNREAAGYAAELTKVAGALDTISKAAAETEKKISAIAFPRVTAGLQAFQDQVDPKGAIERQYQEAITEIDRAIKTGVGLKSEDEANRLAELAAKRRDAAIAALNPKPAGGGKAEIDPLIGQFERLRAALDPTAAAERELANATLVLEQAQKAGLITAEELATLKERLADKAYEASEAGRAEAAAIAEGVAAAERAITPLEAYERQIANITKALEAGKLSEEQAARARDKVKDELEQANGEGKAAAKTARELGLAFSSAFEDAIVGGKGLRDIVRGLGQDLLRVFIRRQLTEPLLEFFNVASKGGKGGGGILDGLGSIFGSSSSASSGGGGFFGNLFGSIGSFFGFASGGIMTPGGPLPLHAYASGGIADRPQLAMFGEGRRPEAYVPLPDGRSIPVTMRGQSQAGTVINIDARGAQHGVEATIEAVVMGRLLPRINASGLAEVADASNRGGAFSKTVGRRRGR